ncbi:NB-ARC domain, LRR domain containing protein [Trema orientale]|uniref:NB-ARC domain, LRR domain containing protein n=1 Tax=Trema orientale TaxID=63057 RepID=A0A2P5FPD8_TREOI|nr:NB-ARC domain, LRR domain containing protein [Trema orientale]
MEFALVKFLIDVTSSVLLLLCGVQSEIEKIKVQKNHVESFIQSTESAIESSKTALNEVGQESVASLRNIVNDIEDVVDEFEFHTNERRSWNIFNKIINFPKTLIDVYRIATELQRINAEIRERNELRGPVAAQGGIIMSSTTPNSAPSHIAEGRARFGVSNLFLEDNELVGIEDKKKELMDLVLSGKPERTVISVIGMGGSGKTSLVANIFSSSQVKQQFHNCTAWVTVSHAKCTIENILKDTIRELFGAETSELTYRELVEKVVGFLDQKRYLVVLDDVWKVDNLSRELDVAFPPGSVGSRIILTTRDEDVGSILFGVGSMVRFRVEPLEDDKAMELFCRKAFPSHGRCPPQFEEIAHHFVKKCEGLPLGLVALGGLMSTKTEYGKWCGVLEHLNWELSKNPRLKMLQSILSLSYIDLPSHLKRCFLYCCVYPENYPLQRGRLVRLWIAEGFVELEGSGMTPEEMAERYVDDLVRRSLLQIFEDHSQGSPKALRMHDLLRHLAVRISQEKKFCAVYNGGKVWEERRLYRLSIQRNYGEEDQTRKAIEKFKVRSLIVSDQIDMHTSSLTSFLSGFKLLRVLDLKRSSTGPVLPNQVVKFYLLTYLNLKGTQVKKLPEDIGDLSNLQTLDIRQTQIRALPSGIVKLENLRHLLMCHNTSNDGHDQNFEIVCGTQAPPGICELKNLQVLDGIIVEIGSDLIKRLSTSMTQLKNIALTNLKEADGDDLCVLIERMKRIELLSLVTFNENEVLRIDSGNFGVSSPPSNPLNRLTTLTLGGKLEKLPFWFDRSDRYLINLKALHLHWSSLTDEDFFSRIGKLPNLAELVLRNAYEGQKLLFLEGFEKLRCLSLFYFPELNEIVIEKGVMPALGYFHIFHCEELKRPPSGVEHLHCLRELHLAGVSNELIERVREGGSDRSMVKHIRHIWHQGTFPEYLS